MNQQKFINEKKHSVSIILFVLVSISIYVSCTKDKTSITGIPQPIAALIDTIKAQDPDCRCNTGLQEYKWNSDTVYEPVCGPLCECLFVVYNSNAKPLTLDTAETRDFLEHSMLIRNVWSCH